MEFCESTAAIGQTTITSFFSVFSSAWSGDDGVGEVCVRRDLTLLLETKKNTINISETVHTVYDL